MTTTKFRLGGLDIETGVISNNLFQLSFDLPITQMFGRFSAAFNISSGFIFPKVPTCLFDPTDCISGFTLRVNMGILELTDNSVLLSTGGLDVDSQGFSFGVHFGKMMVIYTSAGQAWFVSFPSQYINIGKIETFQFSWSGDMGLMVYLGNTMIGHSNIAVNRIHVGAAAMGDQFISCGTADNIDTTPTTLIIEDLTTYNETIMMLIEEGLFVEGTISNLICNTYFQLNQCI